MSLIIASTLFGQSKIKAIKAGRLVDVVTGKMLTGASEQTASGYSTDTLAMDILAVTKALNLNKVILIGHSIADDEISKFASTYPDKVEKVIYLDAAYDHKSIWPTLVQYMPAFPKLTAADTSSSDGLKAYYKKIVGIT